MALPLLPLALLGGSVALPFIAQALWGGGKEVQPRYPWETSLGRETLDLIRAFQPTEYTGQLTVPITPTEQALAQALAQPLYLTPAKQYLLDALSGQYLRPETHPYLQAMTQEIQRQTETAINRALDDVLARTQRAGIPGGSAEQNLRQRVAQEVAGQTAGQLAQLYGGLYEAERQRQQALLPMYLQYALAPQQQALAGLSAQQYLRQAMLQNLLLPYQEWQRYRQEMMLPITARMQLLGMPATYPQYRLPDWYYWLAPLSQGLATAGGYMLGRA